MKRLSGSVCAFISVLALCGSAAAADSSGTSTGKQTTQGADSNVKAARGSDAAGDTGSKGTQSGENPATPTTGAQPRTGDSAGGPNSASDTAGDTGSQGTQSGQNSRQNPSEEFTAAMQKCGSMSGESKTRCETDAKKKHGQM